MNKRKLDRINKGIAKLEERGDVSDGYHTFDELYFHRMVLFAALCKAYPDLAWKSKLHHDGTMYENYFIAGIETPIGNYTYHIHMEYWDHYRGIKEIDRAPLWGGHKPENVTRLFTL